MKGNNLTNITAICCRDWLKKNKRKNECFTKKRCGLGLQRRSTCTVLVHWCPDADMEPETSDPQGPMVSTDQATRTGIKPLFSLFGELTAKQVITF